MVACCSSGRVVNAEKYRFDFRFPQLCKILDQDDIPRFEIRRQQLVWHSAEELAMLVLAGHGDALRLARIKFDQVRLKTSQVSKDSCWCLVAVLIRCDAVDHSSRTATFGLAA